MKIPITIIVTFLVAFLTSFLLDLQIINTNPVRYWLVVLFIVVEIITGFIMVVSVIKEMKESKE
jgi:hypothetical protein